MQMVINMRALLKIIKDMERAQTSSTTTTCDHAEEFELQRDRVAVSELPPTSGKGLRWTMGHPHQQANDDDTIT